jgi:hypothetical protein
VDLKKSLEELEELENPNGHHGTPRFIVHNAADALKPQPPIEYLVDKLITSCSVNVFFGEPGSKKTYSLLSMAVCAAAGRKWLDFDISEPVKVLVIDEESGERRLTVRLGDCLRGEFAEDVDPEYLSYVSLAGFDLGEEKDVKIVSKLIMDVGAQLVVIDALADIMSGDENSKQETQPVLNHMRKIAENTDCAIVLIHHSNKMGMYRGTSAIKGSVDLMWAARAIWDENKFFMSSMERKEKGMTLTAARLYVLKYLSENHTGSVDDIMSASDTCAPASAKAAIYFMAGLDEPYTFRTNPGPAGGKGSKAIFGLTDAGKKLAEDQKK